MNKKRINDLRKYLSTELGSSQMDMVDEIINIFNQEIYANKKMDTRKI